MNTTPITQLPDGSAFWTTTILSKEEVSDLPQEKKPLNYRISSEMYEAVFQAIGAASMCWSGTPKGVFQAEKASQIAVELCFKIANELEAKQKAPSL